MYALRLKVDGATDDQLMRGLDAAMAVFEAEGTNPVRAADGFWALEGWDIGGFGGELSEDDARAADIWIDAEAAAIKACCEGWERPGAGTLELVDSEPALRREANGTWTIYTPMTGDPVIARDRGPLVGLDGDEADKALELLDQGILELEASTDGGAGH